MPDQLGIRLMHLADEENPNVDEAFDLIDRGAACFTGGISLVYATQRGHWKIVEALLDNSAFLDSNKFDKPERYFGINRRDNCGATALMLAAQHGRLDIVERLLDKGADVAIKNYSNHTAIDYARQQGHDDIVSILQEKVSSGQKPGTFTNAKNQPKH